MTRDLDRAEDDRPELTSRILGVAARGNDVFVGNWHQLYSFKLHPDRRAPSLRLPETSSLVDFGAVEVGKSKTILFPVMNQGTAPLKLSKISMSSNAFSVKAPEHDYSGRRLHHTFADLYPGDIRKRERVSGP